VYTYVVQVEVSIDVYSDRWARVILSQDRQRAFLVPAAGESSASSSLDWTPERWRAIQRSFPSKSSPNLSNSARSSLPSTTLVRNPITRRHSLSCSRTVQPHFAWKPTSKIRSVTCHMGSHSFAWHPTQMNLSHYNHSKTGRYSIFFYQIGIEGWVNFDAAGWLYTEMVYLSAESHLSKY